MKVQISSLDRLHVSVQLYVLDCYISPGMMLGAVEDTKMSKPTFLPLNLCSLISPLLILPFVFNSMWQKFKLYTRVHNKK